MENYEEIGSYYLISHLALITGLSDRTIRSYIASGILKGEKINGLWHFTLEEVDTFLRNPAVMPSVQAKRNGIVYDFMNNQKKTSEEACLILDLPGHDPKTIAEFFCYSITNEAYQKIHFAFDHTAGTPRVILRGRYRDVHSLVQSYYNQQTR